VLCDKAKEILMEESNVQVSFFFFFFFFSFFFLSILLCYLHTYILNEFAFLTRIFDILA